jgi:hypothetical protein
MSDQVFPNLDTGPDEFFNRDKAESADKASLVTELQEQGRLGNEQIDVWSDRRVEIPGTGAGGRVDRNPNW